MLTIGITGSIATGKTTVTNIFAGFGAPILIADEVVHLLLKQSQECIEAITERFGEDVIVNFEVDRKKLADIVFNDPEALKDLENIIHPLVRSEIERFIEWEHNNNSDVVFIEIPLLYEGGWEKKLDKIIVVNADEETQLSRINQNKKISADDLKKRLKNQISLKEKLSKADFIINNNQSLQNTLDEALEIWNKIQQNLL